MKPILQQLFGGEPNVNADILRKLTAAAEAAEELGELFSLRVVRIETDSDLPVLWLRAEPEAGVFSGVAHVWTQGDQWRRGFGSARHRDTYVKWPIERGAA